MPHRSFMHSRGWAGALILAGTGFVSAASGDPTSGTVRWAFESKVANLEYLVAPLVDHPPAQAKRAPAVDGVAWHALIPRRSPGDPLHHDSRYVPVLAEYVLGQPVRVWCDGNLNGDLADDAPAALTGYPRLEGARSFLVDLGGNAADKHRVVLEQQADATTPPRYRLQRVHSMMGEVEMEGRRHRAVLHDGNADGVYTSEFGDGLLVDLDDDLHFEIDPMSPAFGPFSTPFQMGSGMYEVSRVEPAGTALTIRRLGDAEPFGPAKPGLPAPLFEMTDTAGRTVRLADHRGRHVVVYFWSSRCGLCEGQAAPLRKLYEQLAGAGLEILAVSYDPVREEMEAFRRRHGQTWPTSFTGRAYWENPVGRRYRAGGSGLMYLVDGGGVLVGRYTEVRELEDRLREMIPQAAR
jgi:thiol-disulfide isomerase/thioredoxin